jgi:5-methylcytosine-specific restriction endonuclease McrA
MSKGRERQGKHQPNGKWITAHKKLAIVMRDHEQCAYCGVDVTTLAAADVTLDHLIPRSILAEINERMPDSPVELLGVVTLVSSKPNDARNLVVACRPCNSSRGAKTLGDFAPGGALIRIAQLIQKPLNTALAKEILANRIEVTR